MLSTKTKQPWIASIGRQCSMRLSVYMLTLFCAITNGFSQGPAKPDLAIDAAVYAIIPTNAGQALYVKWTLSNTGAASSPSSYSRIYLSKDTQLDAADALLNQQYVSPLDTAERYSLYTYLPLSVYTIPENYFLLIQADPGDTIAESNENNNIYALQVQVKTSEFDLDIANFKVQRSGPLHPGIEVMLTNTLRNIGNSYASQSFTGYFLSKDTIYDQNDAFLGSASDSSVFGTNMQKQYGSVMLPYALQSGNYYFLAVADYSNNVPETNENNNTSFIGIQVIAPNVDLVLNNPTLSQNQVSAGGTLTAYNFITNTGTDASYGYISTGYYLSKDTILNTDSSTGVTDLLLGQSYSAPLKNGESFFQNATIYMPVYIQPGNYYLIFKGDISNNQPETNEQNNLAVLSLKIIPSAIDLQIVNAVIESTDLVSGGENFTLHYFLSNAGTTDAPFSNSAYLLSKDQLLDSTDIYLTTGSSGILKSGASVLENIILSIPSGIKSGNYYILAIADYYNSIPETNEQNNLAALPVKVRMANIDLSIENPTVNNTILHPGDNITLTYVIKNSGSDAVSYNYTVFYLSSDSILSRNSDLPLGSAINYGIPGNTSMGGYLYSTIPNSISSGRYYILFVANGYSTIQESDSSNNVTALAVDIVVPSNDLVIRSLTATPPVVAAGSFVNVSNYLINTGREAAYYPTTGYFLSSDSIYSPEDGYLNTSQVFVVYPDSAAFQSVYVQIPAYDSVGSKFIIAVAGFNGSFSNAGNGSNIAYTPISIVVPDMDLRVAFTSNQHLVSGGSSLVSYQLTNSGSVYTSQNYTGFYLSKDSILDVSMDIFLTPDYGNQVPPGTTLDIQSYVRVPSYIVPGDYFLFAVADYYSQIKETNEFNNEAVTLVTVTPAILDLGITSAAISSNSVNPGASVNTKFYVYSTGNSVADSVFVHYYISADSIYDLLDMNIGIRHLGSVQPDSGIYYNDYVQIPAFVPSGKYFMLIRVSGSFQEFNFQNNIAALPLQITEGYPDLTVSKASIFPTNITPGKNMLVQYSISNIGGADAESSSTAIYISEDNVLDPQDRLVGSNLLPSIGSGGTVYFSDTLLVPSDTRTGRYSYIFFVADSYNSILELNEQNNVVSVRVGVGQINDTASTHVTITGALNPKVVSAGDEVTFTAFVQNTGGRTIPYTTLSVYIIPLQEGYTYRLGQSKIDAALYPSAEHTIGLTVKFPGFQDGAYYVKYVADEQLSLFGPAFTSNIFWDTIYVNNYVTAVGDMQEGNALTVSPNPAQEAFNISFTNMSGKPSEFTLYNQLGQTVWSYTTGETSVGNVITVPCEKLGKGLFLLKANNGGKEVIEKVIIQ